MPWNYWLGADISGNAGSVVVWMGLPGAGETQFENRTCYNNARHLTSFGGTSGDVVINMKILRPANP